MPQSGVSVRAKRRVTRLAVTSMNNLVRTSKISLPLRCKCEQLLWKPKRSRTIIRHHTNTLSSCGCSPAAEWETGRKDVELRYLPALLLEVTQLQKGTIRLR